MEMTEEQNVPVTRIRLRIPKGMKVSDVISKLEITFEEVEPTGEEIKIGGCWECCVDAAVVSPISTVQNHPDENAHDQSGQ
jgi:hypothetical protein